MLWLISGLGGDERLYSRIQLPDESSVIDWNDFGSCLTMEDFVDQAIECGVRDGDYVVGSSFGGMLGCELSTRIRLGGLLLLGSAIEQREINRLVLLAGGFARSMDGRFLQTIGRPFSHWGPKRIAVAMFCDQSVAIMMNMYRVILN